MAAIAALGKLALGEFDWFYIAWSALLLPTLDPHWTPIVFMGWRRGLRIPLPAVMLVAGISALIWSGMHGAKAQGNGFCIVASRRP